MIRGKLRIDLTPETVLQKISSYDIFRRYMPDRNWKLNEVTNSPFRRDSNPSMLIGNKFGELYYIDFGDSSKRGGCFDFVMDLFHLSSLDEALKLIDRDFGLGFSPNTNTGEYKLIKSEYKQPEETLGKRYSLIQVVTRKFTKEELDYWAGYYQDIQDLRRNHVYSIEKMYLNRKLFPLKENELRFGYLYNSDKIGGCWKVYRPHCSKKDKWISNVPLTILDGKDNIIGCKTAFITKSKKDLLVLKKIYPCVVSTQNESFACFSNENVEYIKSNSERQILMYDSDPPGVQSSQQITKLFGFEYCNVPRKYLDEGIKDWAALGSKYGLEIINQILKEKNKI